MNHLAEKLLVLLIDPQRGSLRMNEDERNYLLIGAIAAELVLLEKALLNGDQIICINHQFTNDYIINQALRTLEQVEGKCSIYEYIGYLKNDLKDVEHLLFSQLKEKGFIEIKQRKIFGMNFGSVYRICAEEAYQELVAKMRKVLIEGSPCDRELQMLISLLQAGQQLKVLFPRLDRKLVEEQAHHYRDEKIGDSIRAILYERKLNINLYVANSMITQDF